MTADRRLYRFNSRANYTTSNQVSSDHVRVSRRVTQILRLKQISALANDITAEAMKTRSKPVITTAVADKALELRDDSEPPKLVILPQTIRKQACVVTLAHPRTSTPTRYYHCPETGLYEFTRIASAKSDYRSLLITPPAVFANREDQLDAEEHIACSQNKTLLEESGEAHESTDARNNEQVALSKGYVSKSAEFFVVTPLDPLFLLLPVLHADSKLDKARKLLRPADDIFDDLSAISPHFIELSKSDNTRKALENRLMAVCDMVDAEAETMYRLDINMLLQELLEKAKRMVASGLPPSIEERFVRKVLEVPILCVKRQDTSSSDVLPSDSLTELPTLETAESQSSTLSKNSESSTTTDITIPDTDSQSKASLEVTSLLRLKTAFDFLLSSYIPLNLHAELNLCLASSTSPFDFSPLTKHLSYLASLRAEAVAIRTLASVSMKRNLGDDEDAVETRVEKKRKKEEEEKRKKIGESRGVRDLKKVDTKGMRKLSDFFGGKKGK